MEKIFFDSWESLIRTGIIGVLAYVSLILMLRIAGSRTLSQLNAFDLIVTVALGSTLATIILNKDITLSEGLLALGLLILFQFVISKLSLRFKSFRSILKSEPRVLFYKGDYVMEALEDCRITKKEVLQMIRAEGAGSLQAIDAVVLESNGRFSVIRKIDKDGRSVLKSVRI